MVVLRVAVDRGCEIDVALQLHRVVALRFEKIQEDRTPVYEDGKHIRVIAPAGVVSGASRVAGVSQSAVTDEPERPKLLHLLLQELPRAAGIARRREDCSPLLSIRCRIPGRPPAAHQRAASGGINQLQSGRLDEGERDQEEWYEPEDGSFKKSERWKRSRGDDSYQQRCPDGCSN